MDYSSDLEITIQRDFDNFIDPALLTLPAAPVAPDPLLFQPLSITSESHGHGLAAEPCFPINLRQDLDGNSPINSTSHTNSNRRQNRRSSNTPTKRKDSNEPLLEWYNANGRQLAYPTKEVKEKLATACGKTVKQVSDWFANRRHRDKEDPVSNLVLSQTYHNPTVAADPQNRIEQHIVSSNGCALQINSPPPFGHPIETHLATSNNRSNVLSGLMILRTSASQPPGRKGKKRVGANSFSNFPAALSPPQEEESVTKRFPCTVGCGKSFNDKHNWQRHEATHLPGMWICMPDDGSPVLDVHCVFCGFFDPKPSHFNTHHGIEGCRNASPTARGFVRKHQLRDHINRVHLQLEIGRANPSRRNSSIRLDLLDGWKREPSDLASQCPRALECGFCQRRFDTWSERSDHVGTHLQDGADLSTWST